MAKRNARFGNQKLGEYKDAMVADLVPRRKLPRNSQRFPEVVLIVTSMCTWWFFKFCFKRKVGLRENKCEPNKLCYQNNLNVLISTQISCDYNGVQVNTGCGPGGCAFIEEVSAGSHPCRISCVLLLFHHGFMCCVFQILVNKHVTKQNPTCVDLTSNTYWKRVRFPLKPPQIPSCASGRSARQWDHLGIGLDLTPGQVGSIHRDLQ